MPPPHERVCWKLMKRLVTEWVSHMHATSILGGKTSPFAFAAHKCYNYEYIRKVKRVFPLLLLLLLFDLFYILGNIRKHIQYLGEIRSKSFPIFRFSFNYILHFQKLGDWLYESGPFLWWPQKIVWGLRRHCAQAAVFVCALKSNSLCLQISDSSGLFLTLSCWISALSLIAVLIRTVLWTSVRHLEDSLMAG